MGERSASEMAELEIKEVTVTSHLDQLDQRIKMAVMMASNCHLAYEKASPQTRRLLNHAFFEKIYLKNKGISSYDYTPLFEALLSCPGSNSKTLVGMGGY